jgi:putative zinc ribbon protein
LLSQAVGLAPLREFAAVSEVLDPVGVLEDGTVYYAPISELVRDGDDHVRCHLCGRWMRMVGGAHLRWHGWKLDEYRDVFQLRQGVATCSRATSAILRRYAKARVEQDDRFGFQTPPVAPVSGVSRAPRWRSLARVRPSLLIELHPIRNGDLDPSALAASSHRKLWWRCPNCGHEWQAAIGNRVSAGAGCPACALERRVEIRRKVDAEQSIAIRRPDLAAELHPVRNDDLDPYCSGAASSRRVWWCCRTCGHEWRAVVANRASGTGCPECWNARRAATFSLVSPERSLADKAPQLVAELHPTRNQNLNPTTLGAHSSRKVWWRCLTCEHEWQALISSRTAGGGCPHCARRRQRERGPRPVERERSIAAKRPELLLELHPTRNPSLDPYRLGAGSNAKMWWRCGSCDHEWQATVRNRTHGSGCPICARRRPRLRHQIL